MPQPPRSYQSTRNMDNYSRPESWRRFFVILAGKTNDAHLSIVKNLQGIGQTQVGSVEECDYLLVFCPSPSRVEADIRSALDKIPNNNKPAILVVMHHTFNPNYILSESSSKVNNTNVLLTVDCLFESNKLLKCNRNDIMWYEMRKFLGATLHEISVWRRFTKMEYLIWCVAFVALIIISVIVVYAIVEKEKDQP